MAQVALLHPVLPLAQFSHKNPHCSVYICDDTPSSPKPQVQCMFVYMCKQIFCLPLVQKAPVFCLPFRHFSEGKQGQYQHKVIMMTVFFFFFFVGSLGGWQTTNWCITATNCFRSMKNKTNPFSLAAKCLQRSKPDQVSHTLSYSPELQILSVCLFIHWQAGISTQMQIYRSLTRNQNLFTADSSPFYTLATFILPRILETVSKPNESKRR